MWCLKLTLEGEEKGFRRTLELARCVVKQSLGSIDTFEWIAIQQVELKDRLVPSLIHLVPSACVRLYP